MAKRTCPGTHSELSTLWKPQVHAGSEHGENARRYPPPRVLTQSLKPQVRLLGRAKSSVEGAGAALFAFVEVERELILRDAEPRDQILDRGVVDGNFDEPVEAEEVQPRVSSPAAEGSFEGEGVELELGSVSRRVDV